MNLGLRKFGVLFCALLATAVSSGARAADERAITVADVHNFTARIEAVINNGTPGETRDDLSLLIARNAQFSENIFRPHYQAGWSNVAYGYGYPAYYGRPYATYGYAPANFYSLSKGGQIDRIVSKKHTIAGYQVQLDVTNIEINPYGSTAMVSLDVKEYGRVYSPYYAHFEQVAVQGNSRCRMYLMKGLDAPPVLTRLDCNTNSNLPL